MKSFKRIIAAALTLLLALSFAGCHKKDEIAVTIGEVKFTSAYYMCALLDADRQAKALIYEDITEEEQATGFDIYSKKVENKDYVTWVEEKAVSNLKTIAAYKILCSKNKLELKEEDKSNAQLYASYAWAQGEAAYYEPNGVSQNTYNNYMTDNYYAETYFNHLYGKGGEKEIAADKLKTKMSENFVTANILSAEYTEGMSDADKTTLKNKFTGYMNSLKDGSKTFKAVYDEYKGVTAQTETAEKTEEESEEPKPKDEYASIIGAEDTGYDAAYYETVKKMAVGEIQLIELEDKSGLVLAVKQDINADPYYIDALDSTLRHLIADEEYEKTINEYVKTLKVDINKFATGQFKVKKIIEPSYQ